MVFLSFLWYSWTWEIWFFAQCRRFTHMWKNPLNVKCEPNLEDIKMRFTLFLLSILMENSHQNRNILNAMTDLKRLLSRSYSLVLSFGKTSFLCKIHSLKFRIKSPKMEKIIWGAFRENIFFQKPSNSVEYN